MAVGIPDVSTRSGSHVLWHVTGRGERLAAPSFVFGPPLAIDRSPCECIRGM